MKLATKSTILHYGIPTLLFILLLSACRGTASEPQPTPPGEDVIFTQAVETVSAQFTAEALETLIAQVTATPPPTVQVTTPTPTPTLTSPTSTATPTKTTESCTNKAKFVDETVPDGTSYLPGETFVKTWDLRNVGTCTWTTDYDLVFVDGDQMSGASPIALSEAISPDEVVKLSVQLVGPASNGLYQGNWQLQNAEGQKFGIGENADKSFWVQINIGESSSAFDPGAPDWLDTFDTAANWYLLETENTLFEVEDGHMIMTAFNPGKGEEWGLSSRPGLSDFYLEATFKTGEQCSGLDRYGVLVRAPDPNQGFVFGFSCDGRFRLYKWDGENYAAIQEWKSAPEILSGPNQVNRLGFWADGETIRLYANRKLLGEYTDDTYLDGRFGLFIGSSNTEDLKV